MEPTAVRAGSAGGLSWADPGSEQVELENPFPIPLCSPVRAPFGAGGHSRRRLARHRRRLEDVNAGIEALNCFGGCFGPEHGRGGAKRG